MTHNTQKIRVIHIITRLNTENTDGAAMMLYKLMAHTDRHRFEPIVISLDGEAELSNRIRAHGIDVYSLDMHHNITAGWQIFKLTQLLRNLQPDIIQGWMYHGNLAASLANLSLGNHHAVLWNIHHALPALNKEARTTRWVIELAAKRSSTPEHIIYNTYLSADQHTALGYDDQRSLVIPNGFDTQLFAPNHYQRNAMRHSLGIPADAFVIGLFAHYHPVKNHALFLEAARLLLPHQPNVHFILAGRGVTENNPKLQYLLNKMPTKQNLHLLGGRKDIPHLMNALDLYTLTSSYGEGFPESVAEAMACGIPCVTTDVSDLARIIGNTGQCLPVQDTTPSALAFAWLEWMNAGDAWRQEVGSRAMQRIQQGYNIQTITDQYQKTYQRLVEDQQMSRMTLVTHLP
ncbi:glycosyltransferase [Thiothrix subterranea]|uniref:Glycosyltransferase n=1 Tax=Thiothrix subterranea TaxID=2735563 RepID=A0AA51MRQ8_9GAMM|nr:glycosyltransferase [Thiothrix subterranea]MDQ5767418.1 glycosyltransferase [Thiothrix subterranea]WML88709.1 glycosyltransferase [Thiothrix subterranea]